MAAGTLDLAAGGSQYVRYDRPTGGPYLTFLADSGGRNRRFLGEKDGYAHVCARSRPAVTDTAEGIIKPDESDNY